MPNTGDRDMSNRQTLFKRLMAANPAEADFSIFAPIDEVRDVKIAEIGEFERRLVVVLKELLVAHDTAQDEHQVAIEKHDIFHDDHPDAEHGDELCKALGSSLHVILGIEAETRLVTDILMKVVQLEHPNQKAVGLRSDGSVAAIRKDYLFSALADGLRKEMGRDGMRMGAGVHIIEL